VILNPAKILPPNDERPGTPEIVAALGNTIVRAKICMRQQESLILDIWQS